MDPIGSAISWDGDFNVHTEGEIFASVIDLVLNCACFIYIGAWIPFDHFTIPELGITPGKLMLLAVGILFLRRIPAILMLYKWIPEIRSWREALFSGHFGMFIVYVFDYDSLTKIPLGPVSLFL
jgi:NhaP-type Na+/H+ or K+/H+ antiporter